MTLKNSGKLRQEKCYSIVKQSRHVHTQKAQMHKTHIRTTCTHNHRQAKHVRSCVLGGAEAAGQDHCAGGDDAGE